MTEPREQIIADLAVIERIARTPGQADPLLRLLLVQAKALDEIATWAANAQRLAADRTEPSDA